jgi:putative component of membrane protein insertase Oxa1/YidC/SpoIIIJ protein YidD
MTDGNSHIPAGRPRRSNRSGKAVFCVAAMILLCLSALVLPRPVTACSSPDDEDGGTSWYLLPINLFQRFVSPADGDRCPMYPSCSAYGKNAFTRHGPLMGWILTSDRLLRCGRDEVVQGAAVRNKDRVLTHDSVENNDFWWK